MNTSKSNIVIVSSEFPPQPGGIGNHAYYLGLYLAKNGYTVTVIADQRSFDATDGYERGQIDPNTHPD